MSRNAYWALSATAVVGVAVFLVSLGLPREATAFWPFSSLKAAEIQDDPILHDSSLDLLDPATNPDPNPNKGGVDIAVTGGSALLPSAGPDGTLPDGIGGPVTGSISLYLVHDGDALSEIADMFGVSTNTILWANDLKSAKDIHPGDTLLILPVSGVQHKVAKGDTVSSISKKYSADAEEVASYNGLESGATLVAGDTIIIPGGDLAPKPSKSVAKKSSGGTLSKALPALTGYFGNPVPGARLSQGIHGYNGVDLAAPNGTPVYSAAAGTVIVAKANGGYNGGYGNYIVVSHDNGTQTLYAHLSSVSVSVGQSVGKDERIGGVGITGRATGYHVHFEVRGAKNPFGG